MYAPVAMIVGNFPMVALQKVALIRNTPDASFRDALAKGGQALSLLFFRPIGLMIVAVISIMILVKVPKLGKSDFRNAK